MECVARLYWTITNRWTVAGFFFPFYPAAIMAAPMLYAGPCAISQGQHRPSLPQQHQKWMTTENKISLIEIQFSTIFLYDSFIQRFPGFLKKKRVRSWHFAKKKFHFKKFVKTKQKKIKEMWQVFHNNLKLKFDLCVSRGDNKMITWNIKWISFLYPLPGRRIFR